MPQVLLKAGTARNIPAHNPTACKPHQAYALSQMFDAVTLAAVKPGLLLKAADDSKVLQDLKSKEKVGALLLMRCPCCVSSSACGVQTTSTRSAWHSCCP